MKAQRKKEGKELILLEDERGEVPQTKAIKPSRARKKKTALVRAPLIRDSSFRIGSGKPYLCVTVKRKPRASETSGSISKTSSKRPDREEITSVRKSRDGFV